MTKTFIGAKHGRKDGAKTFYNKAGGTSEVLAKNIFAPGYDIVKNQYEIPCSQYEQIIREQEEQMLSEI